MLSRICCMTAASLGTSPAAMSEASSLDTGKALSRAATRSRFVCHAFQVAVQGPPLENANGKQ